MHDPARVLTAALFCHNTGRQLEIEYTLNVIYTPFFIDAADFASPMVQAREVSTADYAVLGAMGICLMIIRPQPLEQQKGLASA